MGLQGLILRRVKLQRLQGLIFLTQQNIHLLSSFEGGRLFILHVMIFILLRNLLFQLESNVHYT